MEMQRIFHQYQHNFLVISREIHTVASFVSENLFQLVFTIGNCMKTNRLKIQSVTTALSTLLVATLSAQVPAVPVAIPNVPQVPGTLLFRSAEDQQRITNIMYHNGSFYTNTVGSGDRKRWTFSDPTNASTFGIRQTTGIPSAVEHGNHAHTKTGDWVGGFYGAGIRRTGVGVNSLDVFNPEFETYSPPTDMLHTLYWPWAIPFQWIQYAGMDSPTPTSIMRPKTSGTPGSQTLFSWNSLAEDGVTGNSILLGNLLFITSDASNLGVLCYDISPVFKTPAERPILLDKLTGNFGSYISIPFEHYIILADLETRKVEVIDFQDPSNLKQVASIDCAGDTLKEGAFNVTYMQAQDNFVFAMRHKINMDNFTKVLELSQTGVGRPAGSVPGNVDTSQYLMPIGNLLISGGYSFADGFDRLGVWAHQAAPDTKSHYVGYHVPRPNQTNFPIGAPISLLIHESLESYTIINGETLILREVGTTTPIDC